MDKCVRDRSSPEGADCPPNNNGGMRTVRYIVLSPNKQRNMSCDPVPSGNGGGTSNCTYSLEFVMKVMKKRGKILFSNNMLCRSIPGNNPGWANPSVGGYSADGPTFWQYIFIACERRNNTTVTPSGKKGGASPMEVVGREGLHAHNLHQRWHQLLYGLLWLSV